MESETGKGKEGLQVEQVGSEGGGKEKSGEGRIEHWKHRKNEFPEIAKKKFFHMYTKLKIRRFLIYLNTRRVAFFKMPQKSCLLTVLYLS